MASRRVRSCTGLRRKADAPPAMARSRASGKSWPVTMMTGSPAHFRASWLCTLNPSMCGMCRSRTTQSGRTISSDFKNSAPDPNVSTIRPAERINRVSAVRTGSSSSMTAMSGCALVTGARGYPVEAACAIRPKVIIPWYIILKARMSRELDVRRFRFQPF